MPHVVSNVGTLPGEAAEDASPMLQASLVTSGFCAFFPFPCLRVLGRGFGTGSGGFSGLCRGRWEDGARSLKRRDDSRERPRRDGRRDGARDPSPARRRGSPDGRIRRPASPVRMSTNHSKAIQIRVRRSSCPCLTLQQTRK